MLHCHRVPASRGEGQSDVASQGLDIRVAGTAESCLLSALHSSARVAADVHQSRREPSAECSWAPYALYPEAYRIDLLLSREARPWMKTSQRLNSRRRRRLPRQDWLCLARKNVVPLKPVASCHHVMTMAVKTRQGLSMVLQLRPHLPGETPSVRRTNQKTCVVRQCQRLSLSLNEQLC